MKTPITDRLAGPAGNFVRNAHVLHASHARRLELDRAALMDALQHIASRDWIENALNPQDAAGIAERALAAARANFPPSHP
jgi:hypothetical protein